MSSLLFAPIQLRSVTLKNRLVVSPMCQYSSVDGFANDWHLVHLGARAVGGAGLIIMEATAVSPEGRISPNDQGLWSDEHIPKLSQITSFLETHGCVPAIQLAHAGRKASTSAPWLGGRQISAEQAGWRAVAPSPIPFHASEMAPEEMSVEGIEKVIKDFRLAAARALAAGFKVIEIHAAHGYLIHQFLSPISNKRIDDYGGSFENRTRLLIQVLQEIQQVWPAELPIFVRISATDWAAGGWNEDEATRLSGILHAHGVTLIDVSSGGMVPSVNIPIAPSYQVRFATRIKREIGILTGAVGLITDARQAEDILSDGQADLVLMGREILRNPYFPLQAAKQLEADVKWPVQYQRATV